MAAVTAQLVKQLRDATGAGMMDCKKALTATEGDMEKAVDYLKGRYGSMRDDLKESVGYTCNFIVPNIKRMTYELEHMMEGTDAAGNACRVFVENQGTWEDGFIPRIVTDSPLLADWETARLSATVEGIEGGVLIRIRG